MKAIIFAGGTGTRLWPLSRKNSPKQFEKIAGDNSTLELAVNRLIPEFNYKDIYISSNIQYKNLLKNKLPNIPQKNFILEPCKRDVAAAIALSLGILNLNYPNEPIAILWSDHLVQNVNLFKKIILKAGKYIKSNPDKIVFITHKARYPSINLGYIHFGPKKKSEDSLFFYEYKGMKYRPDKETATRFIKELNYAWNLGYFITTPSFIVKHFKELAPGIWKNIEKILTNYGKKSFESKLKKYYEKNESISFDNAILEKLNPKDALVMVEDIGWSDIGSWESLKEALQKNKQENIIRGKTHLEKVSDSLIYNYENKKMIVVVDIKEAIIVNTDDVLLITTKHSMPKIKKIVESFKNTKHEVLT